MRHAYSAVLHTCRKTDAPAPAERHASRTPGLHRGPDFIGNPFRLRLLLHGIRLRGLECTFYAPWSESPVLRQKSFQLFLPLFFMLLPLHARAGNIPWPALPKTCFVKGRPATRADVKRGCAAFVAMANGKPVGKPLDIAIPQYAYEIDKEAHAKTPVVVIQAEQGLGIKMAGVTLVGSHRRLVELMSSLQLLGTNKPE